LRSKRQAKCSGASTPLWNSTCGIGSARAIEHELRKYDPGMLEKPRWLVLNKADLMFEDEARERAESIVAELQWREPWFMVSALSREGTWPIMLEIQRFFDRLREEQLEADAAAQAAGQASDA